MAKSEARHADKATSPYRRRLSKLKTVRSGYEGHWRLLVDAILPRRGRLADKEKRDRGGDVNRKIINSKATTAARTAASGMMSGITSPARPWFRLTTPDTAMMEVDAVRLWLHKVEHRMRLVFEKSNFYNSLHVVYEELVVFGTAGIMIEEDYDDVIRCTTFSVGEYYIASNSKGVVDTAYREFTMSVIQLVEEFGIDAVGKTVADQFHNGQYDEEHDVVSVIEPNTSIILGRKDAKGKKFRSVYFLVKGDEDSVLREGGFDEFPGMFPRWHLMSGDDYGRSPGMDALGDTLMLQMMERRKAQAVDKMVDPPMKGPGTLKATGGASTDPGSITYVNEGEGSNRFEPSVMIQVRVAELSQDIARTEQRIDETFYANLFLRLANDMRNQRATAREVDEVHEEKLLALGPVLERVQDELLTPAVNRTFNIMREASMADWQQGRDSMLPMPPKELQNVELRIEYISLLAQAQQAVSVGSIERFMSFAGNMAGTFPEVIHKVNPMQALDEYGRAIGTAPTIIRSDDEAARRNREQQQAVQQAQQVAQMGEAANAARLLSEADTGGRNVLADALGTGVA